MYNFAYKKTVRRTLLTTCLMAGMLAIGIPAKAQDVNSRLSRIENEIQTLSRAVFRGENPPPGSLAVGENVSGASSANTELRLQQIEMELRTLTGRIEEQSFENQQVREQMDDLVLRLERRIATLEAKAGISGDNSFTSGGIAPGQPSVTQWGRVPGSAAGAAGSGEIAAEPLSRKDAGAPSSMGQLGVLRQTPGGVGGRGDAGEVAPQDQGVSAAPSFGAPDVSGSGALDNPAGLYDQAFALLRNRNYDEAEKAFSTFLERYPEDDLAPNAKYWLGETFYVRNNFERAARVFAEAYQKYPNGPKGPDNLLKLGMSLAGLGKKQDACVTFAQLEKEYPSGAMPVIMRAEKEMEKLDCSQF